ncbi:MAG: WD40 repeat domain-containing protein [Saprospiraceae bacterium]
MNSFLLFLVTILSFVIFIELSNSPPTQPLTNDSIEINSLAFAKVKSLAAIGKKNGKILLWDTELDHQRLVLEAHNQIIDHLLFSKDGRWLLSLDTEGLVILWSTRTGDLVQKLPHLSKHGYPTNINEFVDIDTDCHCLVFELKSDSIILYNYKTGEISSKTPIL